MKIEKYIPECASFIDGSLYLSSKESLIKALKDGCLSLKIPEDFDLRPGIKISKNFYLDKKKHHY